MISISSRVQSWLNRNPTAYSFLSNGLMNHSALARTIRSDIEAQSGEKVSVESVTIALNRAGKSTKAAAAVSPISFVGDVSVQTGLDILIYEIADFDAVTAPSAERTKQGYYVSTRGIWHASIITTSNIASDESLSKNAVEHQKNITSTTIRLKPGHIPIPGVCAGILSLLANQGVNMQEVISTHNELTILTDQRNAERALGILIKVKASAS